MNQIDIPLNFHRPPTTNLEEGFDQVLLQENEAQTLCNIHQGHLQYYLVAAVAPDYSSMNSFSNVRLSDSNFLMTNSFEMGYKQHLLHYQSNGQIRKLEVAIYEVEIGLDDCYYCCFSQLHNLGCYY